MTVYDCTDPQTWGPALDEAVNTIGRGGLIVLPTDTVYGIGADAFSPTAVAALLAAKGRSRQAPPPVLIADTSMLAALTIDLPDAVTQLANEFWPGALTIICRSQPALRWDLGETAGTVALRIPAHDAALALLARTGPLAVSSANLTGAPPATNIQLARAQLSSAVSVYLDAGTSPGGVASTIVDATGDTPKVVRRGALDLERLRQIVPEIMDGAGEPA